MYVCAECGYQTPKWLGRCTSCGSWNTLNEEILSTSQPSRTKNVKVPSGVKNLKDIAPAQSKRISSGIMEFDRVLGGGAVPGSVILIGGEPGIGKSTLLLQVSERIASQGKVLYISGEESPEQIKLRSDRLGIKSDNIIILPETDINLILDYTHSLEPKCVIIDSIQTINNPQFYKITGSFSQIRETTSTLLHMAKKMNLPVFLIGHVTKEGNIAGPKALEHIVDVVLYMEGERYHSFRLLKSQKNRFGSTYEIGVFEMTQNGLEPVSNPSSYFLEAHDKKMPGSVITTIMEGTRPLLVELQALVVPSNLPYPRRVVEGTDFNKLLLLTAILEKLVGLNLAHQEIYLKIAGGMKIKEPSIDLAIAAAVLSSAKNKAAPVKSVLIGEVGLTGEIRPVTYINQRIDESIKMGFEKMIIPYGNLKKLGKRSAGIKEIQPIKYINELNTVI